MSIHAPGAAPRRARARRAVDTPIALVPFIDFLLTVVVFLLMSFGTSGEITVLPGLPEASHGTDGPEAPVVAIDADQITIDGRRVADTRALLASAGVERVEPLVRDLEIQRQSWAVLHPGEDFPGHVVVQASREVDYRAVRKVLFSIAQAGYGGIALAVRPVRARGGG
ncbi:MAG: biopolymer transporter ExbD [Sandaracinaceae bacterium]|nr:biopolymer transporter ExbD [Sandaracinaceae bacterium]